MVLHGCMLIYGFILLFQAFVVDPYRIYYCPTLSYRTTLVQFDDIDNADMYGFMIT